MAGRPFRAVPTSLCGKVVVLGGISAACSGSPRSEPPITAPRPPTFQVENIVHDWVTSTESAIVGRPGAVEPGGSVVRGYNLENTAPAQEVTAGEDGGFAMDLAAEASDGIRLQARIEGGVSAPLDRVVGDVGAALDPVVYPLEGCLTLPQPLFIVIEDSRPEILTAYNECEDDITLSVRRRREALDLVEMAGPDPGPHTLAQGESVDFEVRVAEGRPGDEQLFFIDVASPVAERRTVTVWLKD